LEEDFIIMKNIQEGFGCSNHNDWRIDCKYCRIKVEKFLKKNLCPMLTPFFWAGTKYQKFVK
jgi:hypothetical protein